MGRFRWGVEAIAAHLNQLLKCRQRSSVAMRQQGFFVWRDGKDRVMSENQDRWIKAKLKTHRQVTWVFPNAVY